MIDFNGFIPMLDRLDDVRAGMAFFKNNKMLRKWEKRGDYKDAPLSDIVDSVYEEWEELVVAIDPGTDGIFYGQARARIQEEVIDLIVVLEMLWDVLDLGDA
jgi:hypothetical protein